MSNNEIIRGFDDETDEKIGIELQKVEGAEGCLVLALNGYIDTYNSGYFQQRAQKVIEAGYTRLIINCFGLSYISSTGIGTFLAILKEVKPLGGDLVLSELQPKVNEVLQLLGFSQFFNTKSSLGDAIALFSSAAGQTASVFPKEFLCFTCSKELKAVKPGRFRCSGCKTIIAVDEVGEVSLG